MVGLPSLGTAVGRVVATAQNGLEVIRLGGLQTDTEPTPFKVVETEKMYRLRRYFPDDPGDGMPHIILIPPMMVSANVYDVTERNGAVTVLHDHGVIPWVIDFGSPDHEEGGMERTLTDHVLAISRVVDFVRNLTGSDVHIGGYSQGGMFAYQTVAYRRSVGISSIVTFGSPVDVLAALPLGLPANLVVPGAEFVADKVFNRLWIPGWLARTGFQLADPVKTARARVDFLRKLHDRDALLPREDQRRFIEQEGWVAWSGPAIAELLRQFVVHNRMITGGFVIDGEAVSMTDITCPILAFVGETDDIGQPAAVRGIVRAAPDADVFETRLPAGHFGLVVGSTSGRITWPTVGEFVTWVDGKAERPENIEPMSAETVKGSGIRWNDRLTYGVNQVAGAGTVLTREVIDAIDSMQRTTFAVAQESVRAVPRLFRLGQIQPSTRISLGKLMSENKKRNPKGELFLFEDRVLTHEQVNTRIDNVVAGLIHCGVRPGAHIGVMMAPRPSALVAIAALSRLGAVAVMLSAADDVPEMMRMADTSTILSDPLHLERAAQVSGRVLVLGGGSGDARSISEADGRRVIDMEQIDPEHVRMPDWYRPDPGQAGDLAFVLFNRTQGRLVRWSVTNHRFAQSAFGAAAAANLTSADTVYCLPPLYHASGLLTTLGATVAGQSRIALSAGLDPDRFATEVRRYGVTVVSYTWSMLSEIVRNPAVRGASGRIRLFMGSGMPSGLWDEVSDVFPEAHVLEFFATADGSAILANVQGTKVGSMGQTLPGTNPVKIAAIDFTQPSLDIDGNTGFVREAQVDEIGVLMAHAGQRFEANGLVLRDVFRSHDRWEVTGLLFRRDADGDFWFLGPDSGLVHSAAGIVYPTPIEQALSRMPAIDDVVVFKAGVPGRQLAIAAITLRDSAASITPTQLRVGLGELEADQRPHVVMIVPELPRTESYRVYGGDYARRGLPKPGPGIWYRDDESRYRRYTASAAKHLGWGPEGMPAPTAEPDAPGTVSTETQ